MLLKLVREICCWVCGQATAQAGNAPPFKPRIRRLITNPELYRLLQVKFPGVPIYLSRDYYEMPDLEDIDKFLDYDQTNRFEYSLHGYRCSDYTFRLMGQFSVPGWNNLTKGIVWTDKHALMALIDPNDDCWWIEPQSDARKPSLEPWQGSRLRFIMI